MRTPFTYIKTSPAGSSYTPVRWTQVSVRTVPISPAAVSLGGSVVSDRGIEKANRVGVDVASYRSRNPLLVVPGMLTAVRVPVVDVR